MSKIRVISTENTLNMLFMKGGHVEQFKYKIVFELFDTVSYIVPCVFDAFSEKLQCQ